MSKAEVATPADAQILMQLYDLRREPEMRKARNWAMFQFQPRSVDEIMALMADPGKPENHWLRQVGGYWEMAASFVVRGALNRELFLENAGEMLNLYAKLKPLLAELRKTVGTPILSNLEQVVESSDKAKERLAWLEKRMAAQAQQKAAQSS